jgi:hypothetical protein
MLYIYQEIHLFLSSKNRTDSKIFYRDLFKLSIVIINFIKYFSKRLNPSVSVLYNNINAILKKQEWLLLYSDLTIATTG